MMLNELAGPQSHLQGTPEHYTLHAATRARRLLAFYRQDFPHQMRVILWIGQHLI
jgi:hypothetical protein